ncbi:MAG: alpha-galactosidase [Bacilli bacterium]|nr:alpha-galactosidase [Bacilli bacterium]
MVAIKYKIKDREYYSSELVNSHYELLINNDGDRTTVTIKARQPLELISFEMFENQEYEISSKIYVNGYQSWTDSKEFYIDEDIHTIKMPCFVTNMFKFKGYGDYTFKKTRKGVLHGYTYSYIKDGENSLFVGSLNEQNAYLIINHYVEKNLLGFESDCAGKKVNSEFILLDYIFQVKDVFEAQKEYFARFKTREAKKIRGYTSWYNDYQDINEEKVRYALNGINKENYDLFQIDDGYEAHVGDWMYINKKKFPNGLVPIVNEIHNKGLLAGIWLAPFVCERNSRFFSRHNDLVYKENGKEVYAGGNWSKFCPLDINNPDALSYIKKCLEKYLSMGFDFFKLDFLYASALVRGSGLTRAETMHKMLTFLRDVLKDKLILGCGVQLSSAFGIVDYCRVGPDVSLSFDDIFYMKLAHRERVSTKITLQNTIYRSLMNGLVFNNDPDVYILRDKNIKLSKEQKKALLVINTLCGSVYFTSDNVSEYDQEKLSLLQNVSTFREAKLVSYDRDHDLIRINYELKGKNYSLVYDTKKGVLVNG